MKYCPNCGAKVSDSVKFCPKCGTKLPNLQPDPSETINQPVGGSVGQAPFQPTEKADNNTIETKQPRFQCST